MLDQFFNTLFGFMLNWPPLYSIMALSFIISLLIVVIYKLMTNQDEMKRLKEELKDYQKKMKESRDNTEKLMKIQKEAMSTNLTYMKKSLKPTFITFIPILLIFGWMSGHFAFEPLMPGQEFDLIVNTEKGIAGNITITAPEGIEIIGSSTANIENKKATFKLKGIAGDYFITAKSNDEKVDKKVLISDKEYAPQLETYKSDTFKSIQLGNKQLKVMWGLSWIWTYIIFAIVFSIVLRKALKVH